MKISDAMSLRVSKIVQKNKFVKDILEDIDKAGGKALLVGGAVRDIFLDIPVQDLDFEVYGMTLMALEKLLCKFGKVQMLGKSFGVLRCYGIDADWSLPRKDSSGRHPNVVYDPHMSYEQAFIRRDLTINAMGIDMKNFQLIDPYAGMKDLIDKILRAPDLNFFEQDPLRLFRVMQFAGRFDMKIDQQLTQRCAQMNITGLAVERVEQEFAKLFVKSTSPSIGLRWLDQIGKLSKYVPTMVMDHNMFDAIDRAAMLHYDSDEQKIVCIWSVMYSFSDDFDNLSFRSIPQDVYHKLIRLICLVTRNSLMQHKVVLLAWYSNIINMSMSDASIKWLAWWLGADLNIDLLSVVVRAHYGDLLADWLHERAVQLSVLRQAEKPLLTGKDLICQAQGVALGILVTKAYQIQIDRGITSPDALKNILN